MILTRFYQTTFHHNEAFLNLIYKLIKKRDIFIFINKFTAAEVKPRISFGCRDFEELTLPQG